MSAPDTNIHKQEKRHRPSLWGVRGAILTAALILLGVSGFNMINGGGGTAAENGTGVETSTTDVYAPGTNSSATPTATD